MAKLSDNQIDSLCLYYDHSFGIMSAAERDNLRATARAWVIALTKVIEDKSNALSMTAKP